VPSRVALFAGLFFVAALSWAVPVAAQYEESPADTFRERAERAEWTVPMRGRFESPFGYRWGKLHAGIDVSVLGEDRVRAALPGVVTAADWIPNYSGYGLVVKIRHEPGLTTMYAHLASAAVRPGQHVDVGQVVGRAGCTGSCTGTHLHFEVHERGKPVDPLRFLGRALRALD
jgi:murein DD-endopeptidase MepM/ murein hydrolase activator NlpD